ncbi:hypothetical protein TNCV_2805201 [Trichonephila clavipes]|nr:hypothetical protein TNCV_2805201 [Trichonephila clavipes]
MCPPHHEMLCVHSYHVTTSINLDVWEGGTSEQSRKSVVSTEDDIEVPLWGKEKTVSRTESGVLNGEQKPWGCSRFPLKRLRVLLLRR